MVVYLSVFSFFFFFFKPKTAYEMLISDWSSDVCSSDLRRCLSDIHAGLYISGYDVTTGKVLWKTRLPAGGQTVPDSEYASAFYYGLYLRPWLIVRLNIQHIVNPGDYHHATA